MQTTTLTMTNEKLNHVSERDQQNQRNCPYFCLKKGTTKKCVAWLPSIGMH